MIKNYDILIITVFDLFEEAVYYYTVRAKDMNEINDDYIRDNQLITLDQLSLDFNEFLQDLDDSSEFPYTAFRAASNPKVVVAIESPTRSPK